MPNDSATLSLLLAACGARGALACGGFGFARNIAATFNVFYWLQVTNYGVLYVLFDPAPNGSNHIDIWDVCLHAQTAPELFRSNVLATSPGGSKPKKVFDSVRDLMRTNRSPLFEGSRVLVCLDEVARFVVKRESQRCVRSRATVPRARGMSQIHAVSAICRVSAATGC